MISVKPVAVPSAPPRAVSRTVRKIALCGSHTSSLTDAPWNDPTWEWWGHASSRAWYSRPMDRYFDLHVRACWTRGGKKTAQYPKWLATNTVPIYMEDHYPEVPASIKYPKGRILMEFSYAHKRHYFANHIAWMIALAISEGATHIGLFGINYSSQSEYERQRGSAEYWLGQLDGRGITVYLPEQCSLLREPALLYGYESHDEKTGKLVSEYLPKVWKAAESIEPLIAGRPFREKAVPTDDIAAQIALEEMENPRPSWAMPNAIGRSDGQAQGEA